jgi:hypothetical protein
MQARHLPRSLARYAPIAAAILGSAAFAAPAGAQAVGGGGGGGGAAVPTIQISYNTADINLADFDATTATVKRGGATIGTGTFGGDPVAAPGELGLNSAHNVAGGIPTGCWTGFTPQILPGDVVTVGAESVTIPDITAQPPVVQNGDIVVHGTAAPGTDLALLDVQLWPAAAARFGNGRQFMSAARPQGFGVAYSYDAGSATNWTARFIGVTAGDLALASTAEAIAEFDPAALAAVDPAVATIVDFTAGVTPGPVAGCGAPFAPNEAKAASRSLINAANVGSDLTVNGVSQPGASASGVTLIDSTGRTVSAPAIGAGLWSGTIPASALAGLADGAIRVASNYSIGAGNTVSGLVRKDTTAPGAVRSSVAGGTYASTQNVALSAAEGTIRYTTDGSQPAADSKSYSGPISVAQSQSIKAIAIDDAGNASQVAQFDYTISPRVIAPSAPAAVKLAKLKIESLTFTKKMSLRSARKSGFSSIIYAPEGAKIAHIRILKGAKVIQTINRKVSRDGVLEVRMPSTKKLRKSLKRGSYRVEIQIGQNLDNLGAKLVRTIRLK